jgi:hypothetical protein
LIDPEAEYQHNDGLAVVGGYVYRGLQNPDMLGKYIFGDFSRDFGPTGRIFYLDADGDRSLILEAQLAAPFNPLGRYVLGFGEDEDGELYLLTSTTLNPLDTLGEVFRIGLASCCVGDRGNVDGDPGDQTNVADLTYLVDFLFRGGPPPPCQEEGNVNGDPNEDVNVADLTYLVDFLFRGGPPPPGC